MSIHLINHYSHTILTNFNNAWLDCHRPLFERQRKAAWLYCHRPLRLVNAAAPPDWIVIALSVNVDTAQSGRIIIVLAVNMDALPPGRIVIALAVKDDTKQPGCITIALSVSSMPQHHPTGLLLPSL